MGRGLCAKKEQTLRGILCLVFADVMCAAIHAELLEHSGIAGELGEASNTKLPLLLHSCLRLSKAHHQHLATSINLRKDA